MKKFAYELTETDTKTLILTLDVILNNDFDILTDGVSKIQQAINNRCCKSALHKLLNYDDNFHVNEIRMMAVSLVIADMILKEEIYADNTIKNKLFKSVFSINHLNKVFEPIMD